MLVKKNVFYGLAIVAFFLAHICFVQTAKAFSPEYVLKNNVLKRIDTEGQSLDKVEAITVTGADFIAYPVSKDIHEGMKGSTSGIYFFNKDGSFKYFVKSDDAATLSVTYDVYFSQSGNFAVFDSGTSPERELKFYDMRSGQEFFSTIALGPFGWVGGERFLMTLMEDNAFARDGVQYGSGTPASVAVYFAAQKNIVYLKKCSEVADYFIQTYDITQSTVTIKEILVPNSQSWKDYTKYKESIIPHVSLPQ